MNDRFIENYQGWMVHLLRVPTVSRPAVGQTLEAVDNYSAIKAGVAMNTTTLPGIKGMVDSKNQMIREGPSWRAR